MIIDFQQQQLHKFDLLAEKIVAQPMLFLQFDSVADFYQASWLSEFPQGTHYACTGLDDGAEQFDAVICYKNRRLSIACYEQITVKFERIEE